MDQQGWEVEQYTITVGEPDLRASVNGLNEPWQWGTTVNINVSVVNEGTASSEAVLSVWGPLQCRAAVKTNGVFYFRLTGLPSSGVAIIEPSTNLIRWVPVHINTTPGTSVDFFDDEAANFPTRFYRAVIP